MAISSERMVCRVVVGVALLLIWGRGDTLANSIRQEVKALAGGSVSLR